MRSKIKIQKTTVQSALRSFQKNFKISFLRIPTALVRVPDPTQIVLQISPDTFCSKMKIRKTMALQSFQIIFENLLEVY